MLKALPLRQGLFYFLRRGFFIHFFGMPAEIILKNTSQISYTAQNTRYCFFVT